MDEYTSRDALIAEMLGDIGKLHDLVARLRNELPDMVAQVDSMLAASKASNLAPHKAAKQFLDEYIKHELKGIFETTNKAKDFAIHSIHNEILGLANTELVDVRIRSKRISDAGVLRFERAIDVGTSTFEKAIRESAKLAEVNASGAISKICKGLSDNVHELQIERRKSQWLAMVSACALTGLLVGAFSVFFMH